MNIKALLVEGAIVFAVCLLVSVVVSALWSLIAHGACAIDWETSFRFAILFAIIVPWIDSRRTKAR